MQDALSERSRWSFGGLSPALEVSKGEIGWQLGYLGGHFGAILGYLGASVADLGVSDGVLGQFSLAL